MSTSRSKPGILRQSRWNPYAVGAAIGVLSWVVFALVDKPLGVTTSLTGLAGACAVPVLGAETIASNDYFKAHAFKWDYGMVFLGGIALGGFLSSLLAGTFRAEAVPSVWRERFGGSVLKRMSAAFVGGILAMYGARLADGCTSGNGISGSLQLAVGGWTFFLTLFAVGVITAALLFGTRRSSNS
jgi:uncharacterized membrane protein YedE/YeeE